MSFDWRGDHIPFMAPPYHLTSEGEVLISKMRIQLTFSAESYLAWVAPVFNYLFAESVLK